MSVGRDTDQEAPEMQNQTTAQAMQHRADLIEKLNSQGARPQMTSAMTTAQLEDFLAWSEGTGGPGWRTDQPSIRTYHSDALGAVTIPDSIDYGGAFDGFQVTSDADPGL